MHAAGLGAGGDAADRLATIQGRSEAVAKAVSALSATIAKVRVLRCA